MSAVDDGDRPKTTLAALSLQERKMLLVALDNPHPKGAIAVDWHPGEPSPFGSGTVQSLVELGLLKGLGWEPYFPHPDVRVTRCFYDLTEDGRRLALEFRGLLALRMPDDINMFRQMVRNRAHYIVSMAPAGVDTRPLLEKMVQSINAVSSRFVIVTTSDESQETWTFDVIPSVVPRRPH